MAATTKQVAHTQPIRDGESYPLEVFKHRTGLSAWELQDAKCAGLKVRHVGKQDYILGRDWLTFLNRQSRRHSLSGGWLFVAALLAKLFTFWMTKK